MGRLATGLGALAIVAGIVLGAMAFYEPSRYGALLREASAIQITQVYTMAGWYAQLSVISFLFAIAMLLSALTERLGSK